jgi:hypothetical protein
VTKAEIRIAQTFRQRDWVPLRPAFLRIMSMCDGKANLARTYINRDLREGQLRAVLVAFDGTTIKKLLEPSDWQQRAVRAAHIPAEGVWVEPYEEGYFHIWRADLDEEYPITPVTAANRERYAEGGSEPAARTEESIPGQAPPAEPPPEPKLAPPTEPEVRTEVAEASSARSPGGHRPVAESEADSSPPVDAMTIETTTSPPEPATPAASANTAAPSSAPSASAANSIQTTPKAASQDAKTPEPPAVGPSPPHMSREQQTQWLKDTIAENPPGKDEPMTPEGYGKRIADMGISIGAIYKPSAVITRYYQLNPKAPRRRKPRKKPGRN